MADENNEEKAKVDESTDGKQEKGKKKASKNAGSGKSSMLAWAIMALIVVVCSAGGGIAANIFMSSPPAVNPTEDLAKAGEEILGEDPDESRIQKEFAYYSFDPLTVNLDVQRQNRYVRITVVLAIPKEDEPKITEILDKKKVELKNWIMTYMAGHTLEQVAGRKNMVRIQREIADSLNEQLWPNQRPRINHVLFKDYAVQ